MKEYIEREAALRIIDKYGCSNGSVIGCHSGAVDCAGEEIARIPAADVVEVRHGRWENNDIPGSILSKCSECGILHGSSAFNYCPDCGAKMEKED